MDNPQLRLIPNLYKDSYYVTPDGRVFKKLKNKPRRSQFEGKSTFINLESNWFVQLKSNTSNSKKYHRISIGMGEDKKNYSIHRLVAQTFIPNPLDLPQVNHIDGDKNNNCVENLEWVTNQENNDHALKVGLKPSTDRLLVVILLSQTTKSTLDIAKETGYSKSKIVKIQKEYQIQRPENTRTCKYADTLGITILLNNTTLSCRAIARELNCQHEAVSRIKKELAKFND